MAIYVLFIKVFKQVVGKKWETELGYQRSNKKTVEANEPFLQGS